MMAASGLKRITIRRFMQALAYLAMTIILSERCCLVVSQADNDTTRAGAEAANYSSYQEEASSQPNENSTNPASDSQTQLDTQSANTSVPAPRYEGASGQQAIRNRTDLSSKHNLVVSSTKSKPILFDTSNNPAAVAVAVKGGQKLALQILIADKKRASSEANRKRIKARPSNAQLSRKRPYDILGSVDSASNAVDKHSAGPIDKLFYSLGQHKLGPPANTLEEVNKVKQEPASDQRASAIKKSGLIRSQHRPPSWYSNQTGLDAKVELDSRSKVPTVTSGSYTTEFYQLISSAHSPIELGRELMRPKIAYSKVPSEAGAGPSQPQGREPDRASRTTTTRPGIYIISSAAPVGLASGEEPPTTLTNESASALKDFISRTALEFAPDSSLSDDDSGLFNHAEVPTLMFDGKKQVTIIRHSSRRPVTTTSTTTTTVTHKPSLEPPMAIVVTSHQSRPRPNLAQPSTPSPSQLVRLISKHKHKYDDNIVSPTLTVVDGHAIRVPPNATSVHNNKLIVAIRPGRPMRPMPPTTQFPVYNIVAGITPPYASSPHPYKSRPASGEGTNYGLLKPTNVTLTTTLAPTFGAANIKFPAPSPSHLQVDHVEYPAHFNVSVPDSAHHVGPNGVPDKIVVNSGEQHVSPPDAVATSDSTLVSRPLGSITISNGIEKLSTTRKPLRFSTTKRINIVSANTTVITTDPEELHEMLNGVIAGSHVQHNITTNHRPSSRPGFFAYVASIFNNSFTTTLIAALTIVKTILVAILVMFLPPLALASAIMQAVSLG